MFLQITVNGGDKIGIQPNGVAARELSPLLFTIVAFVHVSGEKDRFGAFRVFEARRDPLIHNFVKRDNGV